MATFPETAPLLTDSLGRNEAAETAGLWRKIARWQNWAYKHALRFAPGDLAVSYGVPFVSPATYSTARGRHGCTHSTGVSGGGRGTPDAVPVVVGRFYCPPPRSFAQRVRFHLYCAIETSGSSFSLDFVDVASGAVVSQVVDYAFLGSATSGWATTLLPIRSGNVEVRIRWIAGGWGELRGICGWWEQLSGVRGDVTIDTAWTAISQAHVASDRADHAALARWLVRKANLYLSEHPLPVVAAWLGPSWPIDSPLHDYQMELGNTAGSYYQFDAGRIMARYKILASPYVTTLYVRVGVYCTGGLTGGVEVKVDGSSLGTFTPSATGECQFHTDNISLGPLSVAVTREVTVESVGTFGSNVVHLYSVEVWERSSVTASQLGLPAGDSIPAAFVPIADEAIGARMPIVSDHDKLGRHAGRAEMVRNLIWLWATRGDRHHVSDSHRMRCGCEGFGFLGLAHGPNVDRGDGYTRRVIGTSHFGLSADGGPARNVRAYLAASISMRPGGDRGAHEDHLCTIGYQWGSFISAFEFVPAARVWDSEMRIATVRTNRSEGTSDDYFLMQATADYTTDGTHPQGAALEEFMP